MSDRSIRNLKGISDASTNRVLNLAAITKARSELEAKENPQPFFESPVINSSIILKHRLRADETYLFPHYRPTATKIIVPFDINDLNVGGRSLFVGQRGFVEALRDIGNYGDKFNLKRDLEVFRLLDAIPSLDPFLLREYLRSNDIKIDDFYFEISDADQARMYAFASIEVRRLIRLATREQKRSNDASISKLVGALLTSEIDETLDPLQHTLRLAGDEFREGIFSWRGFLYYKWCMHDFWPEVVSVLREIKAMRPSGAADQEQLQFLTAAKKSIADAVRASTEEVRRVLKIYDDAYEDLIERSDPRSFRQFLLGAPALFLELGEKMGAMSHISSFWRYRFPRGSMKTANVDELITILQDFSAGFDLQNYRAGRAEDDWRARLRYA